MKRWCFLCCMIAMVILIMSCGCVFATSGIITGTVEPIIEDGNIDNLVKKILGYIMYFALGIAVGGVIYIGIKYLMAPANERAELKTSSVRVVIGVVVISASTAIFSWIAQFVGGLFN